MPFSTDTLVLGNLYTRKELVDLWGYKSFHAFGKGVFTPSKKECIVLFVTREKQKTDIQFKDFINSDRLYWEGEEKHLNDNRIANAYKKGEAIYLFYRDIHHTPFRYFGEIRINKFKKEIIKPSEFVFELRHDLGPIDDIIQAEFEFSSLPETEKLSLTKARLGQGQFRENLFKYWKGCAITNITKPDLLRASHIKPWRSSDNSERLDPYNGILLLPQYDLLFDRGYITFDENGFLEPSQAILKIPQEKLGIDFKVQLRKIQNEHLPFLEFHRENTFFRKSV